MALPDARRPRFLLPRAGASATASVLTSYVALRDPRTRLIRRALAAAARLGAIGRAVGEVVGVWYPSGLDCPAVGLRSFAAHLRGELDVPAALMATGAGAVDAHYKPAVQLFSATGEPVGYAKLGWTDPTAALVRRETDALRRWRQARTGDGHVRVPAVLVAGSWDGLPYVVTDPLPNGVEAVDEADPLPLAAHDVAGALVEAPLDESPYWASVRQRLEAAASRSADPLVQSLRRAACVLSELAGKEPWAFGRWHGDWVPWNVATTAGHLYAWDWEHSTACAPWGFDLLHWQVTGPHLRHGVGYRACVERVARAAPLPGVIVATRLLVLAYLVEMGLRSLELHGATPAPVATLYPGLTDRLGDVASAALEGPHDVGRWVR